jgi:hypothetical protein
LAYTLWLEIKMEDNAVKVKWLIRGAGLTIAQACKHLGVTRAGFDYKLKHGTLRADEVIKLSALLGVDSELILNAIKGEK